MHRLDLQPARSATAGLVGRCRRLGHHSLVAGGQRCVQEFGGPRGIGGGQPVDPSPRRHQSVQGGQPVGGRRVQQVDPVVVQDVEEEHRKWLRCKGCGDIHRSAEA